MTVVLKDVRVFGRGGVEIIKGVSAEISGKALLVGPNGSGKTTLLRAVCGVVNYEGSITIDGREVRGLRNYLDLSCNLPETMTLGIRLMDKLRILEELKGVDVKLAIEMLREVDIREGDLSKRFHNLSAGQRVLFSTIMALASKPKYIFIDEPFENVDYAKRRIVIKWLREFGTAGLVVTHELDQLEQFGGYPLYLILSGKLFGPVGVEDFLDSSVVVGEDESAILTIDIEGKRYSLVKGVGAKKIRDLGEIDKLYLHVTE
nr:MAG: ABC transporter [Thermoproteus sp. AZ2]